MSERGRKLVELARAKVIVENIPSIENCENECDVSTTDRCSPECTSPLSARKVKARNILQQLSSDENDGNSNQKIIGDEINSRKDHRESLTPTIPTDGAPRPSKRKQEQLVVDYGLSESEDDPYDSDDSVQDKNYNPSYSDDSEIDCQIPESPEDSDIDNNEEVGSDSNEDVESDTNEVWRDIVVSGDEFTLQPKNPILNPDANNITIKGPIDIYRLLVDDSVLDLIVTETNRYASQKISMGYSGKSRIKHWTDTNKSEICKFLAIAIIMGLSHVPSISLYWSKDPAFHNKFISTHMSRDRFLLILKFLHFTNNETANVTNKLYKIEPLLSKLIENFAKPLSPGRDLVVDESMVPYRGRLHFRQYIPNKSHKYGVKLYKLCTPNGYTYNIKVYSGKGDSDVATSHSESVVLKLLEKICPKEGRVLFADSFYSGIDLAAKLYGMKILYCGTLRANRRGVPKEFKNKMRRGEIYGKQCNKVKVIKWVDKRPVTMVSTIPVHNATLTNTGKTNRKGDEVFKPQCVLDYNQAKKGVDLSDQMSSYHSVLRKGIKWYRKVAFEVILGTALVNSWIVFNMVSTTKVGIVAFRRQLAEELLSVKEQREEVQGRREESTKGKRRLHTLVKPDGPGRKKRKVCKGCYDTLRETLTSREADKRVKRIISYCQNCPNMPGFCLPCFNRYHN
ncbi:unnamed protein product [Callosobruchus maculatus]|uniref:PiggyBac transposable element-derived protein domain-containing protein n=1 Tax=Callosobruchus maculatus TaxID=64391 RepID=A0A653C7V2_CALMS|nr:unnamed protein product [Callosobruchus maculatus]